MARNKSRKTLRAVGLQLETELIDKVDALAEQQTRSRAGQIRWMVQRVLREFDAKLEAKTTTPEPSDSEHAPA